MKVALLADIHGNSDALAAVISDAGSQGAAEYWVLGDLLGYGPDPNGTVELLKTLPARVILGNYCRKLLQACHEGKPSPPPQTLIKRVLFRWTLETLNDSSVKFLESLSAEQHFDFGGKRVAIVHARPGDDENPILKTTSDAELEAIAAADQSDIICFGHTHRTLDHSAGGKRFINPGPLGRPEDGDPRAYYAIVDTARENWPVSFRRVTYDWDSTCGAILQSGLPQAVGKMYISGLRLKDILNLHAPDYGDLTDDPMVQAASKFCERCNFNPAHEHHVVNVCSHMFDALWAEHGLGREDKLMLICASYLHDIGWTAGKRGHHKTARDIILRDRKLPFTDRQRTMIAQICRYHRRALPSRKKHKHYSRLSMMDRWRLRILAGILRTADGIDHSHLADVDSIECKSDRQSVIIGISGSSRSGLLSSMLAAQRKSDLLSRALGKQVTIVLMDKASANAGIFQT